MTTDNVFAVCGQQVPVVTAQQELRSQQQNHREFHQQTINAMEQAPIPDTSSSQGHASFHGFGSEDINSSLDKMEQYLNCPTALADLILTILTWPFKHSFLS